MPTDKMPADANMDCPLSPREQTRNLLIYASNWGLIYLASPVTYVGVVQAALLNRLGFDRTQANLPASVYLWTSPFAVLVAWYFPQVRLLRPLIVGSFLLTAFMGAVVTLTLLSADPVIVQLALVTHAAVLGCTGGVVVTCQWEMIGRGVSEARRGQALALAFGAGPVLAVVASIGSQLVLAGKVEGIQLPFTVMTLAFPWNFAALFAASTPILALGAVLSSLFVVPPPTVEVQRQSFIQGVLGGAGEYFGHPFIRTAALAYILVYSGHMILNNISLYTEVVLGQPAENYTGLLLTERFGFKIVAGFALGWLLMRTNPKTLLVVTALMTLSSVVWAMSVPGRLFLICFGILGAGELFGVYYPNYILASSPRLQFRRNMAFTGLITLPVGFAPVLFGYLSEKFGFQMSFSASLAILIIAILLVLLALPARPRPFQDDIKGAGME